MQNKLEIIKDKWDEITRFTKDEFGMIETSYNTWIVPLSPYEYKNGTLTLVFSGEEGENMVDYIYRRYQSWLRISIETITGIVIDSGHLKIVSDAADEKSGDDIISSSFPEIVTPSVFEYDPKKIYTFDNFVVGDSNKLAHAAALSVAENPGGGYNPLFLYGGAGLGKTHLMFSIVHFILKNNPEKKVLYISSENFLNEYIDSIQNHTSSQFRKKFRSLDVLLIDDIQFLEDKQGTQNEFFNTYEALHKAKKQMVISSDKAPSELSTLEERLRSRFEWGLPVDISYPDFETRMAILRKKEEIEGYNIDDEILNYIASNINSNIRTLEGALTKINVYSKLCNKKLDLNTAQDALRDLISPAGVKEVTPDLIMSVVSDHYGVSIDNIKSERRTKNLTVPRQISMYLSKEMTSCSWTEIGEKMGGKDRTTILHGHDKIEKDIQNDEILKKTIDILKKKINPS